MATTKEIELILQARLEQGNAIDNAKALGAGISDALEHAFDGLGERIAAKMMMELKTSLGGLKLSELFDSSGMTGPQGAPQVQSQYSLIDGVWQGRQPSGGAITDINGTAISSQAARPQYGPSLPGGAEQAGANVNNSDNGGPKDEPYRKKPRFGNNYSSGSFMGIEGPLTDSFSQAQGSVKKEQALDMDQVIAKFKAFDTLRKIDPDYKMDDNLKEQVGNAKKFAIAGAGDEAQAISKLAEEIVSLQKAIELNSESVKQATSKKESDRTDGDKGTMKDQSQRQADVFNKMDEVEARQQHMRDTENFTKKVSAFEQEETNKQYEQKRSRSMGIAKGFGMAGAAVAGIGDFVGGLDQMRLDSAAGTAQLENGNMRDFMGGDINSMMATQSLGGDEELQKRSRSNAYWKSGGKMIGGAFAATAATAFALPAAGTTMGVGGLVALGAATKFGGIAKEGLDEFMTIDKQAANNAAAMKQAEMEKQKEYMMMSQMSLGKAVGSYDIAQAMGSPEVSDIIYGAGGSNGRKQNSMRSRAASSGVSNSQFDNYMTSSLANMSGQFMGNPEFHAPMIQDTRTPMRDSRFQAQALNSMKLKAEGFNNIEQIEGTMFNQGQGGGLADTLRAQKEAAALFGEAVGVNMDKLKIPHYLEQMATRMTSTGMGSSGYEKDLINRGLSVSQDLYGKNGLEGKNVMNVQNATNEIYDNTRSNSSLNKVAASNMINEIDKKLGLKLDTTDSNYLRMKKGSSSDPEDVKAATERFNLNKSRKPMTEAQTKSAMELWEKGIVGKNKEAMGWMTESQQADLITMNQPTMQGSDQYRKTFDILAKDGNRTPEIIKPIKSSTTNLGEDEKKILEITKATMLTTGFEGLNMVVETLTKQMGSLIDKISGFDLLKSSVIAPNAMNTTTDPAAFARKAFEDRLAFDKLMNASKTVMGQPK